MGRWVRRLCGALGAVAAALVLLACEAVRRWPERFYEELPLDGQPTPSFSLCETAYGRPCAYPRPVRWLSDFYEPLGRRALAVRASGGRPTVVHIGANDFCDDIHEYRPLLEAVTAHGAPVHLLLVEPEQKHRALLLARHRDLGLPARNVTVVMAAMDRVCKGPLVQYLFSEQLSLDFGSRTNVSHRKALFHSMNSWRTTTKKRLLDALWAIATNKAFSTGEGSSSAFDIFHSVVVPAAKRVYEAGNASEYVIEETVPCLSGPDLVAQESLNPADIIMMTIDAEGLDIPIFMGFTALEGFRPTLQRLEGRWLKPRTLVAVRWLAEKGFKVGISSQSHSEDVVAYAEPPV